MCAELLYSALANALTDLTKKMLPQFVLWMPQCEESFETLKAALASSPVLQAPDFTCRCVIQTGVNAYRLGAVLK